MSLNAHISQLLRNVVAAFFIIEYQSNVVKQKFIK